VVVTNRMASRIGFAIVLFCFASAPVGLVDAAEQGGKLAAGLNVGIDVPPGHEGLGLGGAWQLGIHVATSERLSLALEIGTAANESDPDRRVIVSGLPRNVSLHAVSTLGVLARRALRAGKVRPYIAGGVDYYTSWDDYRATLTQAAGTKWRSGLGVQLGAGSAIWIASRWDLCAEGLYHFATDADDDARYLVLQGGLRFFFGRRHSTP